MTRKSLTWWILLAIVSVVAIASSRLIGQQHDGALLTARMAKITPVGEQIEVPCAEVSVAQPLVLLALGQSNAGNHGAPLGRAAEPVMLIAEGKCIWASAPLPGGTGMGDSIWQRLPALLSMQKERRLVVLSVLAVDATSIDDWTSQNSPLRKRLISHVVSMRRLDLAPNFILWQQGEADARTGTSADKYVAGLTGLAAALNDAGEDAPIILARSTVCQSLPSTAMRSAIEATVASNNRFRLGPDTDTLSSDVFRNGCHLTQVGLDSAAKMWAESIIMEVSHLRSMDR